MVGVKLTNVTKNFGLVKAVDDLSLEAESGKILTVLGPSGAGKTTLLRCISGLEFPERGEVRIGDRVVFSSRERLNVPPEKRQTGMVFQSYAIWPNMSVHDNVAFPLVVRKTPRQEVEKRVDEVLSLVGLKGFGKRPGTELSAGQQQRVALARALVFEPLVLLLDEPLSNLDAKLREHMRVELRELQRRLGITMIYVTHDHAEAFALSDKIMIMHEGRKAGYGLPRELYERPPDRFVAEFLGHTNILPARVVGTSRKGLSRVETPLGILSFKLPSVVGKGAEFYICLRGRMIDINRSKPSRRPNLARAILKATVYRGGDNVDYVIQVNGYTVNIHGKTRPFDELRDGEEVFLDVPPEACTVIGSF